MVNEGAFEVEAGPEDSTAEGSVPPDGELTDFLDGLAETGH